MKKITLSTKFDISYPIQLADDVLSPQNNLLLSGRDQHSENCLVIVDKQVSQLYGEKIDAYFKANTQNYKVVTVDGGDHNKNVDSYLKIFDEINAFPINRRNEPVILIGGGVATDIAAFATSCFRRGIPHIKVPTTLMGYVDASVGIKTGINYKNTKNRMGSFYPPHSVILDRTFFKTLPDREISNGVGEIIKLAVIKNRALFDALQKSSAELMETKFQCTDADFVLTQSIVDMIEELEPNLFEDNLERIVDFGHTFSLVFEMEAEEEVKHGEAVAMDILFSCLLSYRRGLLTNAEFDSVVSMIDAFRIPIRYELYNPDLLWISLNERVLHRNGFQRVPVPTGIGKSTFINDITYTELQTICGELHSLHGSRTEQMTTL